MTIKTRAGISLLPLTLSMLLALSLLPPAITPALAADNLTAARELYATGAFARAVALLRAEAKVAPRHPEVHFWLGKAYLKTRDWKAAVEAMDKAVELAPDNATYHHWLGRACGERAANSFVTTAYSMAKRVVKEFQTATRLAPDNLPARFDLLEYYLEAPGMLGGGADKAAAEAKAIAAIDPQKGYTARANIYKSDKQWDKARAELVKAAETFPRSAAASQDLADYLFGRKDYAGALLWSRKALTLDADSKDACSWAAPPPTALRRNQRELEDAAGELQALAAGTLTDYDPTFEQVYYQLGENFLARGDKARARSAWEKALTYNPDYGRAKDALKKVK